MTRYFPISLKLEGRPALVVGAGRVAERKIKTLLSSGADVSVVAPDATSVVAGLAKGKKIVHFRRKYRRSDVKGKRLVIAATSDSGLNGQVARDAKKIGVWANVVDKTSACEFIAPAVLKRKGLVVAITTDAKDPPLSKAFREFLEARIDEFFSGRHRP